MWIEGMLFFGAGFMLCYLFTSLGLRKQLKDAVEYGFKAGAEAANDKWKTELRKQLDKAMESKDV